MLDIFDFEIEDSGSDWHKRNDVYYRYCFLSSLPPTIPPFWVKILERAPGVRNTNISINPNCSTDRSDQTSKLATIKSISNKISQKSNLFKISRNKIVKTLADETTQMSNEETFQVAVFFELVAPSQDDLEVYTQIFGQLANEIGVDVTPLQGPAEECIDTALSINPMSRDNNLEYCLNLDATAYTSLIFFEPSPELLADIYDIEPYLDLS